ncbi:MAG: hypothetical protein EPGJADBJ_04906 [Saprospiraceae bacterium]|nr:hypothetical protein [Saprospiraceae bacterium]
MNQRYKKTAFMAAIKDLPTENDPGKTNYANQELKLTINFQMLTFTKLFKFRKRGT